MPAFFSNPGLTMLTQEQPSISAASGMQAQNVDTNVAAQDQNAAFTLQSAGQQAQQSAYGSAQQIGNQALAFDSSGVTLSGSPMEVLNKSRQLAIQSVSNIMAQGANTAKMQLAQAAITANQGRAQLLGTNNTFDTDLAQSQIQNYGQQAQQFSQILQGGLAAYGNSGGGSVPGAGAGAGTSPPPFTSP